MAEVELSQGIYYNSKQMLEYLNTVLNFHVSNKLDALNFLHAAL